LNAAQQLMLDDGYAAVTARRLAARAGVSPQLVHYYFRSMDDLFISVVRRGESQSLARLDRALAAERPLHALWELSTDPRATALSTELLSLARHRKDVAVAVAQSADRFRRRQEEFMARALERAGISSEIVPAAAAVVFLAGIARVTVIEQNIGMHTGHDEALDVVRRLLRWAEESE
jgi:AcrR family transcriptional regulator